MSHCAAVPAFPASSSLVWARQAVVVVLVVVVVVVVGLVDRSQEDQRGARSSSGRNKTRK
jgi:hypothetical protein